MDRPITARMVNEALFCERLLYLMWVQQEFEHNYFTVDGNAVHKRADQPGGEMPPTEDAGERPYKARSVWLTSDKLGITAKIDVVEGIGDCVIPIEYKRGKPPDVPERAYLPERAQACLQVMLLREHGYTVPEGALYFAAAKQRVVVEITDKLIATVKAAIERSRALLADGATIPPPLVDDPKCGGCSLVAICLPDEVSWLQSHHAGPEAARTSNKEPSSQLRIKRDDKAPLYVQEQGARVGLSSECLVVKVKDEIKAEVRLVHTSHVCIFGAVQISTQAVRELMSRGIQISYFTAGGWYCGRAIGSDSKNVEVRLAQYRMASDEAESLKIARGLVEAKIKNCRVMLRRNAEVDVDRMSLNIPAGEGVDQLLGWEGAVARLYFEHFSKMLRPPSGDLAFDFNGRNRRPPKDPVNALLSFAYSMLTKDFTIACTSAGLDPLIGFYHKPRHGRPALALDLMEEFRPIIADSVVVTSINTGVVTPSDFISAAGAIALTSSARRSFIQAYERRMNQEVTHPVFGYKVSYRRVLEIQARLMVRHLLGEIDSYPQFLVR